MNAIITSVINVRALAILAGVMPKPVTGATEQENGRMSIPKGIQDEYRSGRTIYRVFLIDGKPHQQIRNSSGGHGFCWFDHRNWEPYEYSSRTSGKTYIMPGHDSWDSPEANELDG